MQIIDTAVEVDLQDRASVEAYWDSKLVRALYFDPKRVSRGVRDAALANQAFARRLKEAAGLAESRSLAARCSCMIDKFATDTGFAAGNQALYLVLGCATTTISTAFAPRTSSASTGGGFSTPFDGRPYAVGALELPTRQA